MSGNGTHLDPLALGDSFSSWVTFIIIVILGVVSIAQVLDVNGVNVLFISKAIREKEIDRLKSILDTVRDDELGKVKAYIHEVLRGEHALLLAHQNATIDRHLHQLGLKPDQLAALRFEILKLGQAPINTSEQRVAVVKELAASPAILVDRDALTKPLYRDVRYYLNFADGMFDDAIGPKLAQLMANHLRANLPPDKLGRSVLVAPSNSNLLLTAATARELGRPAVFMRASARIRENQLWDGTFPELGYPVLVHDVVVSGKQLVEAQRVLRERGTAAHEVFCLVDRSEAAASELLKREGLRVVSITQITDDEIARLRA